MTWYHDVHTDCPSYRVAVLLKGGCILFVNVYNNHWDFMPWFSCLDLKEECWNESVHFREFFLCLNQVGQIINNSWKNIDNKR